MSVRPVASPVEGVRGWRLGYQGHTIGPTQTPDNIYLVPLTARGSGVLSHAPTMLKHPFPEAVCTAMFATHAADAPVPDLGCSCGYHLFKEPLWRPPEFRCPVWGVATGWGRVAVHEGGYRCQHIAPVSLVVYDAEGLDVEWVASKLSATYECAARPAEKWEIERREEWLEQEEARRMDMQREAAYRMKRLSEAQSLFASGGLCAPTCNTIQTTSSFPAVAAAMSQTAVMMRQAAMATQSLGGTFATREPVKAPRRHRLTPYVLMSIPVLLPLGMLLSKLS